MKKKIFRPVIFILIVLFLLVHLTYCLRTNGDVKDRFVGFYWEKRNTVDAVFIGSSPIPAAIATPKIYGDLGVTVFPISSNVQRPVATKYLVEEALKSQSPDLFIFEMRMWTGEDDYMLGNMAHTREVTDNLKYSINRVKCINAMVSEENGERRLDYYFDIFKYHSNWKTLFMWSQLRTFFYSYPDELKGFDVETEVGPCDKPQIISADEKEPIPGGQEECLNELLSYLDEKNLNALFVVTPFMIPEDEQKKINYIADIVTERGYNFLDMNRSLDEIGLDFSVDIRDYGTHTNVCGAVKVTDFFEKYLKENYIDTGKCLLTDHRGDKCYYSWDRAYEKYLTDSEEGERKVHDNIENGIFYELGTGEGE
ncbi:MAG: SGNH/GDSL hydrolase family protein [Butyrivibrio sp.]|nr:SGNH/GDSL hydrolase family protein [Butyrivibrio sp.]